MSSRRYIPALSLNWLTPLYDGLVEGPMSAMRPRRDLLAKLGGLNAKRVLDVGCGTGTFPLMIKQKYRAAEVVGLDGDPQILELARLKARRGSLEIRFDQGMSYNLPYPDSSFDVVLTSMMLHHLGHDDKLRTAMEMYRVLRPGGRLFGMDFTESRGFLGRAIRPVVRHFERVADNLEGFLPIMFDEAGFEEYQETHRYLFGAISLFQASKS